MLSSLQHQLKDSEATIVVLTSDRNRMAVEVDELALRLEELEYNNTSRKVDSASCRTETASFNSYDDETMSFGDRHSRIHSTTSDGSEEGSEGFVPLKRAANFSNINSLDESADFKVERRSDTASEKLASNDSSKATADKSTPLSSYKANGPTEVTQQKEVSHDTICDTKEEKSVSLSGLSILHKDTSWERFDRSNSNAELSNLTNNDAGKTLPTFIDDSTKLDTFKELDVRSPFTQLAKSTPLSKPPSADDDVVSGHSATKLSAIGDPWLSPGQSPIASKKPKSTSRNLFWEKNEDCTIYPFYIPDSNEEKGALENEVTSRPMCGTEIPPNELRDVKEPLEDTASVNISSPTMLSSFSLDEKMVSFDEDGQKPVSIIVKKASKENLWDFEPDSIVDVSTGIMAFHFPFTFI